MRERRPVDHSGHNIREGDIVSIDQRRLPWGRRDRLYLVRRLVKDSAFPQPCAVITPIDKPSYDLTYYVGYLNKVDVTTIPADKWDEFMEWLNDSEPDPKVVESLRKLFASPTPWESEEVMLEPETSGKHQAYVSRTLDHTTIVVIGHDLIVEEYSQSSESFTDGVRLGLRGAGIEVLP